jgi:phosphoribosylformylglycinamidine cyclo-ligase
VPDDLAAEIDLGAWSAGPVFSWLHSLGVRRAEMLNTFNCGLGMVVAMDPAHVEKNLAVVQKAALEARVVGEAKPRGDGAAVRYRGELRL